MMRRYATLSCLVLGAAAIFTASPRISAQPYPVKPVRIIVGFPPGGGNDFIARFIALRLTTALGQQFIVENKPGAGGTIGQTLGVQSPPDGYTLTLISSSYTIVPSLYRLKYDPVADITPIIQISRGPLIVVVHPSLPAGSIEDLLALARSKPGEINYASSGSGNIGHLAAELFASVAGIRMTHIPYRGTGPAVSDTIAGQTQVIFSSIATVLPHVRSGRLRAIAVTTNERIPADPNVRTVAESGLPGYEVIQWHGLIGPKGLPRQIADRINHEVSAVLKVKDTGDQLQNDGVSPAGGTPEQFLATIRNEVEVWRKVVSDAGVKAE